MKYLATLLVFAIAAATGGAASAQSPVYGQGGYGHGGWGQQAMMGPGMMCPGMMGQGMMGPGMMGPGMMGRGTANPTMKAMMMIGIADTNGDQAVSFDEVTAVHKRMFDMVDENKDGKVTRDELRPFFEGASEGGQ
jgi:hypothetical protein